MSDIGPITQPASVASFGAFQSESPFGTTALESVSGALDPTRLIPAPTRSFLSVGESSAPRVSRNLPGNLRSLTRKYEELSPFLNTLPPEARNALVKMDSDRVATGGKPLTREETIKVAQAWVNQQPTTPPPGRKPLDVVGNTLSDLGAIVKSIPQIPAGIVREITSIGSETEGNFFEQPGVRLLPGAFIAGNLMNGGEGARELATHPLFTALDVLPFASKIAEGTRAGKLAMETAATEGRTARPLAAALTQRAEDGVLVDRAPRAALKELRDTTRTGQLIDQAFGGRARDVSRRMEQARDQVISQMNGMVDPTSDSVVSAAQRAATLNERFMAEHGWDQQRIIDVTEKLKVGNLDVFDPVEMAYRNEFNTIVEDLGKATVDMGEMDRIMGEFYPMEQAKLLRTEERRAQHYRAAVTLRDEWRSSGRRFTPDDLNEFVDDALNRRAPDASPDAMTAYQKAEFRNLINVMERYGYDMVESRGAFRRALKEESFGTPVDVADAIRKQLDVDPATLRPMPTASDMARALERVAPKDIQARFLARAIAKGDPTEITQRLSNILRRKARRSDLFPDGMIEDIRRLRDQYREDIYSKGYTRSKADKASQRYQTAIANTPPARFGPEIGRRAREGSEIVRMNPNRPGTWDTERIKGANEVFANLEEQAIGRKLSPDEAADVTRKITEREWGTFKFADHETVASLYSGIENEVKRTWLDLRRAGVEPSFIHTTSRSRVHATLAPKPGPVPIGLSQTQERLVDMSPGINDAGVAVSHQAMEILHRRASEEALDHILSQYGISERDLRAQYGIQARDVAEKDALWGFEGQLKQLIERKYAPVNLKDIGFNWKSARLSKYDQNRVYIPRALHDVLGEIAMPRKPFGGQLVEGMSRLFRISVVGLSPRTHLYNLLGGATMLMGETGPGAFRYGRQALAWARNPELITAESLRRVIGSQRRIMEDFDKLNLASERMKKAEAMSNIAGGRTLGRLWREVQESKVADKGRQLIDKSYGLNAQMDDMYRTMAFLYGYDKSITRGLSKDAAERAGMEMLQRSMMDWASLTPIERSVMKSIFPFYSFMNHAIRYVFRYPVDHPLRAGVLAAFGRAQQEDLDGLLPDRFLSLFTFGGLSDEGTMKGLSLTAVNPFGDVANMLTFTGFLSATNPAVATVLESVGLIQGEAELYPTLYFNPETGRLDGRRTNPLMNLATNVVPQSDLLFSLAGANARFNEQLQRDPAAALRTMMSAGGLPVLTRMGPLGEIPVVEETFKAELARQDAQDIALNEALRSGDWQNANLFPGLQGTQDRIGSLPPEVLAAYTLPERDAIRAQLEALLAGQQPQWQAPDGYQEIMDEAINPSDVAIGQNMRIGGI